LQEFIVDELKREFGTSDDVWWYEGVPAQIRSRVTQRMEEEKNKRGGKEYYFDLIDYRKIIADNWNLFEKVFAFGKGNKDKRTEWLDFVNEQGKLYHMLLQERQFQSKIFQDLKNILFGYKNRYYNLTKMKRLF
jgi:hypothetical protein